MNAHEPTWRPQRRLRRSTLPPRLRPWLLDTGSLTQRLIAACQGQFRVEPLRQGWRRPLRSEARALGLPAARYAWVREVRLMCADVPWVYARTVIPPATLIGRERRLTRLRARSLGAILFADPATTRGEIEVVRLVAGATLYGRARSVAGGDTAELWGRRARFLLNGKPLLVSEIFLPRLGDFPSHD